MFARLAVRAKASIPEEDIRKYLQKSLGLLANKEIYHQPEVSEIYELILNHPANAEPNTPRTIMSNQGAICAFSGKKTGRVP